MTQSNRRRTLLLLLGPGGVFLLLFFLIPLAFVLVESFQSPDQAFTVGRYTAVLASQQFQRVYLRTIKMALIVTPIAVILGYPTAYVLSKLPVRNKSILMSIVILPLMTNPVARTYAWIVMLGRLGVVNRTLQFLGLTAEPIRFIYTEGAIILGLLQLFLPLMILTLVSAMENVPDEVEDAARSLGSSGLGAFFRMIVPLSFDGLVLGVTLVFTGCITAYVTPAILGGSRVLTLATLMRQEALVLMNWESATVIAVIMVLTTLVIYNGVRMLRPREV
jgi:putative spermidine/putrescine transport system permease protein